MTTFRHRLVYAMNQLGLRQIDLAERTGLSKSTITLYVQGKREPRWKELQKLASVLGVAPGWLLGDGDDLQPRKVYDMELPFELENYSQEEKALIEAFRDADNTKKEIVRLTLGL